MHTSLENVSTTQQCRVYPAFNVSPSSLRACYFLQILFSQSGRVACFFLCDARAVECRRTFHSARARLSLVHNGPACERAGIYYYLARQLSRKWSVIELMNLASKGSPWCAPWKINTHTRRSFQATNSHSLRCILALQNTLIDLLQVGGIKIFRRVVMNQIYYKKCHLQPKI